MTTDVTPSPTPRQGGVTLERELREEGDGEVRFDLASRAAYAVDAWNSRQVGAVGRRPCRGPRRDARRHNLTIHYLRGTCHDSERR